MKREGGESIGPAGNQFDLYRRSVSVDSNRELPLMFSLVFVLSVYYY